MLAKRWLQSLNRRRQLGPVEGYEFGELQRLLETIDLLPSLLIFSVVTFSAGSTFCGLSMRWAVELGTGLFFHFV